MFLVAAFLIFFGALAGAGYYAFAVPKSKESEAIALRLRELRMRSGGRAQARAELVRSEKAGASASLGALLSWLGGLRRLQALIDQANLKYRAADVLVVTAALFAFAWLALGLAGLSLWMLRLLFAVLLGAVPIAFVVRARSRRLRMFEKQFPDAIDLFNRSMKAGHTIHSGLESIATETPDPVRMEFKKVVEELALGSPIEDALHNLGSRVPLIDLKFFVTGLILQRQTGANLVEVLEGLGLLIRERLNMAAKLKAHTAQQRMSAAMLCALPVVLGLAFWFLKREYIVFLYTDDLGSKFLTYAVASEIIGILVIRKIASPRF